VQGNSAWTWRRYDGSEYAASEVPALWRRVADRDSVDDARDEFGPLLYPADLIDELVLDSADVSADVAQRDASAWGELHSQLRRVATLWRPAVFRAGEGAAGEVLADPTIHRLDSFALSHGRGSRVAALLRIQLETAIHDRDVLPELDGWHLRVVSQNLRGLLLMTCVADIAARRRFRRCAHCSEWFPIARTDARFCGTTCRQAAHAAAKAA